MGLFELVMVFTGVFGTAGIVAGISAFFIRRR